jgi:hypothetical protein
MKRFAYSSVVAALLLIVTTSPTFGFGKKKKSSPPPQSHETVISAVTPNSITVADDKTMKTYTITQFTEINVNGQKATVADLKQGMKVSVTIDMDPTRVSRIIATGKK